MTNARIIRLPAVMNMIGASKPAIYLWIKNGTFPAPIKIGPKASGWLLTEIEDWIAQRVAARRGA